MKPPFENRIDWPFFLRVGLLLVATLLLRLSELGYSDFQGDEIKAFCRLAEGQNIRGFLLEQRKGPIQFLVTCLYGLVDPAYSSELAVRLPFATASIFAVVVFYILADQLFGRSVAVYAALFLATNGLFVALGRIVQYQSITILFMLIALYSFTRAAQDERWKISGLYLGAIAAAIGILGHFDGVYALPPMVYLLYIWWKRYRAAPSFHLYRNHLLVAGGLFAALLLSFYIPYALQLTNYQLDYWRERIAGASSSTWQLFRFYNPGPIIWAYLLLIFLGLFRLRRDFASGLLMIWLLPPLILNEFVIRDSRTHFYTYLLPLFLFCALGMETIQLSLERLFKGSSLRLVQALSLLLFGFLTFLSYEILVDHNPEYPWQPKTFLSLGLAGGELDGTFGFPYSREWNEIGGWFTQNTGSVAVVATNEKPTIPLFYLPPSVSVVEVNQQYLEKLNDGDRVAALLIESPQSWLKTFWGLSPEEWRNTEEPVRVFRDQGGRLRASVYYMTKERIRELLQ